MGKLVMDYWGVFKMPKLLAGCCSLKQLSALFGHQTNSVVVFLGKKKKKKSECWINHSVMWKYLISVSWNSEVAHWGNSSQVCLIKWPVIVYSATKTSQVRHVSANFHLEFDIS